MKPLMPITFYPEPDPKAFITKLFQIFMVVVLCRSGALLADDSIQNSAVISKEALLLQHPKFQENFDQYEVLEAAAKIPADVSVLIFFGTWCHDSQREVPQNAEDFGGCWPT